jgi:hypothetical protein
MEMRRSDATSAPCVLSASHIQILHVLQRVHSKTYPIISNIDSGCISGDKNNAQLITIIITLFIQLYPGRKSDISTVYPKYLDITGCSLVITTATAI